MVMEMCINKMQKRQDDCVLPGNITITCTVSCLLVHLVSKHMTLVAFINSFQLWHLIGFTLKTLVGVDTHCDFIDNLCLIYICTL